ncbi:RNA polymerase III subunit RPC34 [Mycena kentingensis (nom. inval.)]|nr:RNA polymerase III subunit RPC34 [Mycena kentingensis (nom. inval.)]
MSNSPRRLNEQESILHQEALSRGTLSAKEVEKIISDPKARQSALNFLLGVGLFKLLKDAKGALSFQAVSKKEVDQYKGLSGEEAMVLNHIKSSGNEGIWVKHIKAKTSMHISLIEKALKNLVSKKYVKKVSSVQHPIRKIYMLEGIEPSVALTGGPWYTDNELDTDFITSITQACYKFIQDVSFPKHKMHEGALFTIKSAPRYPTAAQIHNTLRQARLTETELAVEHIEMLLEVLVLDGLVEKLPSFGATLWDADAVSDGESEDERESKKKKKKKRRRTSSSSDEDEAPTKSKSKKRRADTDSDDEDDDESRSRKKSKSKLKRKKVEESDTEDEAPKKKKKKSKKDESEDSDSDEDTSRKKKKKKKKADSSDDESSEDEKASRKKKNKKQIKEESDSDDSDVQRRRRKTTRRSSSPFQLDDEYAGAVVYRAVQQEKMSMGWTEAPCSKCASFDFCKDGGPVNASECVYYGDWLVAGTITFDDET